MKAIIPAIDLKNGKVVRLVQGNFFDETIYSLEPLDIMKKFTSLGFKRVHIVNLDGAKDGQFKQTKNYSKIIEIIKYANKNNVSIQLGGGIRNELIISSLLEQGVQQIILGTIAVENPALIEKLMKKYQNKIIIGLDVLNYEIMTKGWMENSKIDVFTKFKEFQKMGIENFVITDINKDGTGEGTNKELYKKLRAIKNKKTKILASGGIRDIQDIEDTLRISDGVIVGKMFYSKDISDLQFNNIIERYNPSNLVKRIIPCLDVKNGRVVKGVNFKNLKDSGDPVELARFYNDEGADEIVFLDITATLEGRKSMIKAIASVAEEVFIPLTVGGGIKSIYDMTEIIKAGAEKIAINSSAFKNPDLITQGAKKFGSQCIVVAIDVTKINNVWEVFINAGTKATGKNAIEWAVEVVRRGAGELLITSMDKDGTKTGYDIDLIKTITKKINVPVIASGGAGTYKHFKDAIKAGAEAVLAASLFHYGQMEIKKLKEYLDQQKIPVRIE